ncbi:MAG: fumarylacetoacetate hydrolase family protein [Hyphomicrobiaceae bacterium]
MAPRSSLAPDAITRAARFIADMRLRRNGLAPPIEALPDGARPLSLEDGYAIQEAARPLLEAGGFGSMVGWKVGSTSPAMMAALGIPHPCAGTLYRNSVRASGCHLREQDFCQLGFECEIAVRLKAPVPARDGGHTVESVRPAVGAAMVAMETVERRFADFRAVGTGALVADDFFSAGAVLGAEMSPDLLADPAAMPGEIRIDGEIAFEGVATDILGHPLASLAFVADLAASRGTPLETGMVVMLGSISPGIRIPGARRAEASFAGLGTVVATIEP